MRTFGVKFSRYDRQRGEMRLSNICWYQAESFGQAHSQAQIALGGMRDADPDRDYDIAIIDHSRELHRAVDCSGGIRLFETREELDARLAAKGTNQ